jgi:peptidoglycan/LPS O-acetylase OafA/YrhL
LNDAKNVEIGGNRRNLQLDCLRGVAILMVILCHTILFRRPAWETPLVRSGWAGVDLFFVLSGFLISGLLFAEYRRSGTICFRRFAIRRALKIYPAFYALVLLTVLSKLINEDRAMVLLAFLHDVFFMQSYTPGTYGHFWSLSVEEHFYILFPLALYFMLRRKRPEGADPFRFLPWLFCIIAVMLLVARLLTARYVIPFTWQTHLFPTHLRIDSLLFGTLLSYWSHFHSEQFWGFVRPRRHLFLLVGACLISPSFVISQYDPWMYTYGFTVLYLGFGALMLGLLSLRMESWPKIAQAAPRALAFIGGYSYSIYLWHVPWLILLSSLHLIRIAYMGVTAFIVGSIAFGVLASQVIEIPAIRLRDRLFPSSSASLAAALGSDNRQASVEAPAFGVMRAPDIDQLN